MLEALDVEGGGEEGLLDAEDRAESVGREPDAVSSRLGPERDGRGAAIDGDDVERSIYHAVKGVLVRHARSARVELDDGDPLPGLREADPARAPVRRHAEEL